ncbi:LuxR C-terminal-related transcriptional regulator [Rhodoferax sp.]|jgi:DNA-binding NarL/FixJ family response regulator|uniref:response regulator transcription factor n=1 Tax=Rhodoferax sp. TaxID=50421 RepID=UPI0037833F38
MRIAIVEDHTPPRESLVRALATVPHWQVLTPCKNEEEGRKLLERDRPDMLLVDLGLPMGNGLNLIHVAQQRFGKQCLCVVLCAHRTFDTVLTAIRAGAVGYLEKDDRAEIWPTLVQNVFAGASPINSYLAKEMLSALQEQLSQTQTQSHERVLTVLRYVKTGRPLGELQGDLHLSAHQAGLLVRQAYTLLQDEATSLSERESQLLQHIHEGLSEADCAERMGISPHSVKSYRERLYKKLGVSSKASALQLARQRGLL